MMMMMDVTHLLTMPHAAGKNASFLVLSNLIVCFDSLLVLDSYFKGRA